MLSHHAELLRRQLPPHAATPLPFRDEPSSELVLAAVWCSPGRAGRSLRPWNIHRDLGHFTPAAALELEQNLTPSARQYPTVRLSPAREIAELKLTLQQQHTQALIHHCLRKSRSTQASANRDDVVLAFMHFVSPPLSVMSARLSDRSPPNMQRGRPSNNRQL
jgi:hypothetical protein